MPLDDRIVKIGIEINGQIKTYQGLAITAAGTKYANAIQNECEVTIFNLDKPTRVYLLTETSPFNLNRTPKTLTVDAGYAASGTTRIYSGTIVPGSSETQPPDIGVKLKCLTGNFLKGKLVSQSFAGSVPLKQIAQDVSGDLDLALDYQAADKKITNYNYTGAALKEVALLNTAGDINVFVDDASLILKDANSALSGRIRVLSMESGMIGIPEVTDQGLKVTFLLDNQTVLGGMLRIQSTLNPALNGDYIIYKLSFDIATRDKPFYWIAEAKRIQ